MFAEMMGEFTEDELKEMRQRLRPSTLWVKAFSIYNGDPKNKYLSMGCMPCFFKVLKYIEGK